MTSYRAARRSFLRGCAAAPLLLPWLRRIEAQAQGLPAPLRFLIIFRPVGTQLGPPDLWRPASATTTTAFALPASSAPFAAVQSKMVMIDGVNIVSASRAAGPTGAHTEEGGTVALMTGQPVLGLTPNTQADYAAGGRSIDQIFLDQSPALGGNASANKTPVASLQLAADIRSDRDEIASRVLSYLDPAPGTSNGGQARQPLFPETQPLNVYNRLFALAGDPSALRAGRKRSVLEFARRDLGRMRNLIPASQGPKLDAYESALSALEVSLMISGPSSCARQPSPPPAIKGAASGAGASGGLAPLGGSRLVGADQYDPSDPTNHPHQLLGQQHLALVRAAFQCDVTRVATFMWASATSWVDFPNPFNGALVPGGAPALPHHPPSMSTDPGLLAWLAQIDRFYSEQTSAFLQQLDATIDIDGNTLLDNTVVAYVSNVARALDNDQRNVPLLVFGGKNTRLRGGQLLRVTDGPLPSLTASAGNRPTNDVWMALAPIFGVSLPALGAPTQYTGPLPGLIS